MFVVNDDKSIYATRGDIVFFDVTMKDKETQEIVKFHAGDVVRIKVYGRKDAESVVLQKDFPVTEESEKVTITLTEQDTKIGDVISKPKDYWYEVELNPRDNPQTIIGYDEDGPKVFKLFPEGDDIPELAPDPEDFPVVDDELDLTSTRPVQNQTIAREIVILREAVKKAGTESAAHPGCYYRTVNGETEWINPPMVVGEEYRTTERWNGKAVYTKVVDCGALPNADFKSIAHGFGATNIIRSHGMMVTGNGGVAIPYRVHDITFSETVDLAVNKNSIMITTDFDASASTAHVTVWYTKD